MMFFRNLVAVSLAAALSITAPLLGEGTELDRGPELNAEVDYYAVIHTTKGALPVVLFAEQAPLAVRNFVNLAEGTGEWIDPATNTTVRRPYFNGLLFHRVIPGFMIQTGDPTGTGTGGPGYKFEDEFVEELRFDKPGVLGMANAGRNDNGSQFFVTEVPTPHLNNGHTVFGELLDPAMVSTVTAIANVAKDTNDRPTSPVFIERVEVHRLEKGMERPAVMARLLGGKPE